MSSQVVLVTGVGREFGGRLLARLGRSRRFERVIGVDTVPPAGAGSEALGSAEFVRADIRNPLITEIIKSARVDTVVHASTTAQPAGPSKRAPIKELNVIGTMRLLAACQAAPTVRKLVIKSSAAVYGASPRSPAVCTEETELVPGSSTGYAKDAIEIEGYVRSFARRRPDITVTVARLANLIGHDVDTVLTRYFALPVAPTVLGHDARLQLLHPSDALAVLESATVTDKPGVFNVAGDGVLTVGQALRRAGRAEVAMPRTIVPTVGRLLRGARVVDFSSDQLRLLNYGRVVDTTRLKQRFGYRPRWSTSAAFDDYLDGRDLRPVVDGRRVAGMLENVCTAAATGRSTR